MDFFASVAAAAAASTTTTISCGERTDRPLFSLGCCCCFFVRLCGCFAICCLAHLHQCADVVCCLSFACDWQRMGTVVARKFSRHQKQKSVKREREMEGRRRQSAVFESCASADHDAGELIDGAIDFFVKKACFRWIDEVIKSFYFCLLCDWLLVGFV